MKHTPGPWEIGTGGVVFGGDYGGTYIANTGLAYWSNRLHDLPGDDARPAAVSGETTKAFFEKNVSAANANALLISKAPEMVEALRGIVGLFGNTDHTKGHGANSAAMRGDMLNDIRSAAGAILATIK